MNTLVTIGSKQYSCDLSKPLDISIPIKENGSNPNCYYSPECAFKVIRAGSFVGSVEEGGAVNHKQVILTPHGNGTHTECYGHISAEQNATINRTLTRSHLLAELISIEPTITTEGDLVATFASFEKSLKSLPEAVIIRTLPNSTEKLSKNYSGANPPYLDWRIAEFLNDNGIRHLLVDLPSVDKEVDGGKLLAHRAFWGLPDRVRMDSTITELIFVDNNIENGLYLLDLQIINIELDASPSRPILFKLFE